MYSNHNLNIKNKENKKYKTKLTKNWGLSFHRDKQGNTKSVFVQPCFISLSALKFLPPPLAGKTVHPGSSENRVGKRRENPVSSGDDDGKDRVSGKKMVMMKPRRQYDDSDLSSTVLSLVESHQKNSLHKIVE